MSNEIIDKKEMIRQSTETVRKKSNLISVALKNKKSKTNPIPNLNFTDFQKNIILITEDIKKIGKSSFLMKMKNTLIQANTVNEKNHVDGSIFKGISQFKDLNSHISEISKDPTSTSARVEFIRSLLSDNNKYDLKYYKNLLIQGALSIYIGNITPASLEVAAQTYRIYLRQVINENKKQLLILRSDQLKKVNIDLIPVESLIKIDPDEEVSEKESSFILEIKITLKLLEISKNLNSDIKNTISLPLELTELENLSPRHGAVMEFLGKQNIGNSYNKHRLIIRKSISVMDIVKYIPYLHPIGLKMVDKLQEIENKLPIPFVIEGRIHMQAMKSLMLRMMLNEYTAKSSLNPTFKKVILSYRKALKRTSFNEPKSGDIPILGEFAQVAFFSYQHRKLMGLSEKGVLEILRIAKKAVDSAMLVNRRYRKLQVQILTSISSLEKSKNKSF